MFCLWKYKKSTLKIGILYQNWRNFPSCTDCPSSPKLQIRFINLAVDLSLYYLFRRQVYYVVGWVLSAPLIGIVLINLYMYLYHKLIHMSLYIPSTPGAHCKAGCLVKEVSFVWITDCNMKSRFMCNTKGVVSGVNFVVLGAINTWI